MQRSEAHAYIDGWRIRHKLKLDTRNSGPRGCGVLDDRLIPSVGDETGKRQRLAGKVGRRERVGDDIRWPSRAFQWISHSEVALVVRPPLTPSAPQTATM